MRMVKRAVNESATKILVHSEVSLQTTGKKRHKFTTMYFIYPLAFCNCAEVDHFFLFFFFYMLEHHCYFTSKKKADILKKTYTHVYQLMYVWHFVNLKY